MSITNFSLRGQQKLHQDLRQWLKQQGIDERHCQPLLGDAGLRYYYRAQLDADTVVVVDASLCPKVLRRFAQIAQVFATAAICVPKIYRVDFTQGLAVIEDFGDKLLFDVLQPDNVEYLYDQALRIILQIQICAVGSEPKLADFVTDRCEQDLQLWRTWFLERYLQQQLTASELTMLQGLFNILLTNAQQQPRVLIHRDYHARNLFALPDNIGVIDFQDLMWGPITYDAVSLLRDCYIDWPVEQVQAWALKFGQQAWVNAGLTGFSANQFMRYFDLMGVQRHLKALGTFARKYCQDDDDKYLVALSRTLNYIKQICCQYSELTEFGDWLASLRRDDKEVKLCNAQ